MIDNEIEHRENMLGVGFIFHPDLIRATSLNDKLLQFFSITKFQKHHLSDKENILLSVSKNPI
jgi:hypothetical protein